MINRYIKDLIIVHFFYNILNEHYIILYNFNPLKTLYITIYKINYF